MTIGIDIVQISAFKEQFELPGTHFADNFTPRELHDSAGKIESIAGKWAAKEAFIKAWSSLLFGQSPAMHRDAVNMSEIEILKDTWSRPYISLAGEVLQRFSEGEARKIFLSISHDGDYATAVVQI